MKGFINKKLLIHGTSKNDPKNIFISEIGFNLKFSKNSAM